ncbi:hypothetical protein, partial [Citrobacter portucalensis]|uniref:hypothetical protein n=1 Tax=Citrobacter portucalensis TaxID=1639133 RepID=UPI0023AFED25
EPYRRIRKTSGYAGGYLLLPWIYQPHAVIYLHIYRLDLFYSSYKYNNCTLQEKALALAASSLSI